MVSSYIFFSNYYSTYRRNFLLYTTENVLPNDNVPMSVGLLDHVLIERSGLFHSWYTDPSLQGKGKQCNSKVSHHRPCRGREPRHRLGQGKSGRQRGTAATDQMDQTGILEQEDPDMHELGHRSLPTQPHTRPGDFQVKCSIEL